MAQSVNLTNLTDYVNQLNFDIVREAVMQSNLIGRIPHMPGIKNAEVVNGIESSPRLISPSCGTSITTGWTGSVTPFQNTLTVCKIGLEERICGDEIDDTFYGMMAKKGSYNEDITKPFADIYLADKAAKIPKLIENELIAGSTTATFSSTTSGLCNGLLYNVLVTNPSTAVTAGLTLSYNATNAITIVDQMVDKLVTSKPELLTENDLELWMSYADFVTYFQALRNQDWYNYNPYDENGNYKYEIMYPGAAKVKIVAINGFDAVTNSKHYFILSRASNFRFGYDDMNDMNNYEFFYNKLDRAVYYRFSAKIGIQAAFYKYIIYGVTS